MYMANANQPESSNPNETDEPGGRAPWFPFQCQNDFDLARFMQKVHLNAPEIKELLGIIHKIRDGPFHLVDQKHVAGLWDAARRMHGATVCLFSQQSVPVISQLMYANSQWMDCNL
jgi:hypothetical protein